MKKLIAALAALLFGAPFAFGQAPQLGAGQIMGNSTAAQRPARAESLTAIFDRAFCGTNNSFIARVGGTWGCTTTLTNATITGATITGGTIDNTPIGGSTRTTGAFSALGVGAAAPVSATQPVQITTATAAAQIGQTNSGSTWVFGPSTAVDTAGWGLFSSTAGAFRLRINNTGMVTIGQTGLGAGALNFENATSGNVVVVVPTGALGGNTLTLPLATDTLVGKATTDALTNKTVNGLTISPTTGTLTIANGKTATHNATTTFAGVDGKTLTTNNSLTLAGTDATTLTFQGTDTYVGRTTTDTLTNKSISGSSNTLSNIALSSLATQNGYTFVGNNTGGSAVPTAVDIINLTSKATPAGTDLVMIVDQAASGAWKKATVSSLATAAGVSSIAGNTGAFTLSRGISNSTNDIRLAVPYFRATLSADQTMTTGTGPNKVNFNTEDFDSNGWYDNATNFRFTPLVAGKYRVHMSLECGATTAISVCAGYIYVNGSSYARNLNSALPPGGAPQFFGINVDTIINFNGSTDYVEGFGLISCTGTCTIDGGTGPIRSWFEASYVSP